MIILSKEAYLKLKHFTLKARGEISGLGKSGMLPNGDIYVEDFKIFKQRSSFASSVLNQRALSMFLEELMEKGEDISRWNIWWHSHASMGVFWSFTDDNTIDNFGAKCFLSLVINKDLDILGRIDIYDPGRFTFDIKVLKTRGVAKKGLEKEIKKYCKQRIKKCVRKIKGIKGKKRYSTHKIYKKQSPLSEREILGQQSHMDFQSWD